MGQASHLIKGIYGMTVHFAAAPPAVGSPVIRVLSHRKPGRVANDNDALPEVDPSEKQAHDQMIHAALRHFAIHGLGAALQARRQAEGALSAGNRAGYDWWLGICRTLDRRIARQLEAGTHCLPVLARPGLAATGDAETGDRSDQSAITPEFQ